jgi:hypothetical protein
MAKGDFHISGRASHSDLNLIKNDVKVSRQNRKKTLAKSRQTPYPRWVFTPDLGPTERTSNELLRRKHSIADPVCLKEDSTFHGFVFTDSFWSLTPSLYVWRYAVSSIIMLRI